MPEADGTPTEAEHLEGRYPDADLDGVRTYYFGCLRGAYNQISAGHFLWREGQYGPRRVPYREPLEQPWRRDGRDRLDGTLAPRPRGRGSEAPQGQAALHHRDGWTAIAFWDRTGDHRGASSSTFLFDRELDAPAALALARERWPELFERFNFEVVPIEVHAPSGPDS